ncbi:hypothetical protein Tco_0194262 [Tanacetum coccineum]
MSIHISGFFDCLACLSQGIILAKLEMDGADIKDVDPDDEASNHEDASDTGAAPKQQQQVIPQTTAISNIKLPILKKEDYDIWAMEMEHYLEYIDKMRVTAAETQVVEKEMKAKNILLMAIPKEHMRRFHGMDDAKEI